MIARWLIRGFSIPAIAGLLVCAMATSGSAGECRDTCRAEGIASMLAGRAALRSCRLECITSDNLSGCLRSCRALVREARENAIGTLTECAQACEPESSCEGQCLEPVRECFAPILERLKSCVQGCKASAREAAPACAEAADSFACRIDVARGLLACAQACGSGVRASAEPCETSLRNCVGECTQANSCRDACLASAQSCMEPVVASAGTCVEGCVVSGYQDGRICMLQLAPRNCLSAAATEVANCAKDCRDRTEVAGSACKDAFLSCHEGCGN